MDSGELSAKVGIDRISTSDEIRAALSLLPDVYMEKVNDKLWEIPSDLGGYVLVDMEHDEARTLVERLNAAGD
jgi:hypothetical protein